jgi:hypothetical protein
MEDEGELVREEDVETRRRWWWWSPEVIRTRERKRTRLSRDPGISSVGVASVSYWVLLAVRALLLSDSSTGPSTWIDISEEESSAS